MKEPSLRGSNRCHTCNRHVNEFDARFCSGCGAPLPKRTERDIDRYFYDLVHPRNNETWRWLTDAVLAAYEEAKAKKVA